MEMYSICQKGVIRNVITSNEYQTQQRAVLNNEHIGTSIQVLALGSIGPCYKASPLVYISSRSFNRCLNLNNLTSFQEVECSVESMMIWREAVMISWQMPLS
jgi:hypothetical protein